MLSLARALTYVPLIFIGVLAASVLPRLLTGGINTRHLFYGRRSDGTLYFSPERVQLLVFTVWAALSYLLAAVENRSVGTLPEVPTTTLALLGGSHAVYLSGKAYSMLFSKITKGEE
jgi:hypothetical protein